MEVIEDLPPGDYEGWPADYGVVEEPGPEEEPVVEKVRYFEL